MCEPEKRKKIANKNKSSKQTTQINHGKNVSADNSKSKILYFVPGRIQQKRLQILKSCAHRNNFKVSEVLSEEVDYVITEFETREQIFRYLNLDNWNGKAEFVSSNWFTDSVRNGSPLPVIEQYTIKREVISIAKQPFEEEDLSLFNCYACQRKTLLSHKNHVLTDALEIVAKHAELRDDSVENDYPRALAFRKAAGAVKSLPFKVRKISQIAKLKDVGKHSLTIIQDILEDGVSLEVEHIKNDEWFQVVSLFASIYGVGPTIAKQWYALNLKTIDDIREMKMVPGSNPLPDNERINYGVAFHKDLTTPVTRKEADRIYEFIKETLTEILPGVILELMGGFRRGKTSGHDVDILVTHPEAGKEVGVLSEMHQTLMKKGLILYGYVQKSTFTENLLKDELPSQNSTFDNFEKCFYILKFPKNGMKWENVESTPSNKLDFEDMLEIANSERNWKAIRIDVILSPVHQFPFAVVGWTGNKEFNRSVRNYAKKKLNMRLTSHGLWSFDEQKSIPASSEREIFSHLKLEYLEPWERNV